MKLIVGLGNPGPRYRETRHNAGFLVVDELARRHGASFRKGRDAEVARAAGVTLLKPTTMMNLSGLAVQAAATKLGVHPSEILVIHDDIDLPLGRLRIKPGGGGAGGARGVADIIRRIGPGFARLKVGVGRPPPGWSTQNWVLSRFRDDERELLGRVIAAAADAVEVVIEAGLTEAMNRYNGLDLRPPTTERRSDAPSQTNSAPVPDTVTDNAPDNDVK